jgi:hypothetical protein
MNAVARFRISTTMKFIPMLAGFLLATPAVGQDAAARKPPRKTILVQLECIETSLEQYTRLMSAPRDTADDGDLRARLLALAKSGKARVMETIGASVVDRKRFETHSRKELIYPVCYDTAKVQKEVFVGKEGADSGHAEGESIGPSPNCFETIYLGPELSVEPELADGMIYLAITYSFTSYAGNRIWAEWNDSFGESPIQTAKTHTVRLRSFFFVEPGKPFLAAALSPGDSEGRTDPSKKWLVFVRCDIL